MKKIAALVALVIIATTLSLPRTASADKSFNIHSPNGGLVTLLITTCALKEISIHTFDFSESGDTFSIVVAPNGSSDSIESVSIEFREDSAAVQSEFVDVGPGRTTQNVYCPDIFDQIVLDCSGY